MLYPQNGDRIRDHRLCDVISPYVYPTSLTPKLLNIALVTLFS